jgi:hypothetical protein
MYAYDSLVIAQHKNKSSNPQNKTKQKTLPLNTKLHVMQNSFYTLSDLYGGCCC